MTPTLDTKYVFTITARIGDVVTAGETGIGVRRIIPIIGGEVTGAVTGKVLPFGADFQTIRPNELIDLEAKYASRPPTAPSSMSRTRASASARSSCCKSSSAASRSIRN